MTASLAKRKLRVEPAWCSLPEWSFTYGPAVCDLVTAAGLTPDPEQELILDAIFAVGYDGMAAAFEVDVLAPRQQIKTATIVMAELGWIYVLDDVRLVLHTAHRLFAIQSAFRFTRGIIRGTPELSKRLAPGRSKGITTGNGDEAIEFATGQRIQYATRTGDTGRSESVDRLVVDEGFAETEEQSGAIQPTLGAAPDPQILRASSACKLDSIVLRDVRDRGRRGQDPRQAYFEFGDREAWSGCADEDCDHAKTRIGCALDDETRWERIMSALDVRTSRQTIRGFRQSMPVLMFARELMMWHHDPPSLSGGVFGESWEDAALEVGDRPAPEWLGIEVELDRAVTSLAAAGRWADGRVQVGAQDRRLGTDWVAAEAKRIQSEHGCQVVLDSRGPGADLTTELDNAGVSYVEAKTDDVLAACGGFFDAVTRKIEGDRGILVPAPTVTHMDDPELNEAVRVTVKRFSGDRFLWGRKQSDGDNSMLGAATLAHWGVTTSPVPELKAYSFDDLDACDACGERIDREVEDGDYRCRRCIDEGREPRADG